jgi:hypothetical protein
MVVQNVLTFPVIPQRCSLRMDTEGSENAKYVQTISQSDNRPTVLSIPCPIESAQASVGMPWRTSIDPTQTKLLYMPFWEWQLDFMKKHLTNLRPKPVTNLNGTMDFSLKENSDKQARVVNLCFESDEYRKIRMTYYDAGHKTQVFNSLWYPRTNLPVLGIDLLQFHGKKHLAVVDFQPLHQEEHHHDPYHHLIKPIQAQYPSLQGKMSARFYDETKFFSQHMLFARFDKLKVVSEELMPAFQQYVQTHVCDLVKTTPPSPTPWERHAAYDAYSAERDPATAMFEKMFGNEWSDAYVHEFLFSMSRLSVNEQ